MLLTKQRRRDQLSIIANILDIAKEGALKTQIMYRANLSFTQLNDYLRFLLETDFLTQSVFEGKEGYITTIKGLGYLRKHRELIKMVETNFRIRKA